ncbi:unnamed protein product [Paramecium pentaurelia]|uniref:ABC transporter domain-containing protein n=1 Tax=Paramecium pentaurelia TaxID=43138 RepID=A0A8S1W1P9_9CILI|nr:unnamed protein product [Paramecium pentaurelia]
MESFRINRPSQPSKKFIKGLLTDKSDVNSVFSVGQKQLICQAKMILDEKKIIVLDEATANVDMKTDDFIQETLKYKFSDCTIITISHRLNTISDYDKTMVISEGQIVEFDTPFNLLANSINSISVDTLDIQTEFFKIFDIKIQKTLQISEVNQLNFQAQQRKTVKQFLILILSSFLIFWNSSSPQKSFYPWEDLQIFILL